MEEHAGVGVLGAFPRAPASGSNCGSSSVSSLYKMLYKLACMYRYGEMAFIECPLHARPKVFIKLTKTGVMFAYFLVLLSSEKDNTAHFIF